MLNTGRDFARLAIIVALWYLGLTYIPQIVGTCLDAVCGFTPVEIILSIAMPLAFFAVPIGLEMALHKQPFGQALSNLGLTRFGWRGIVLAAVYLLPLLAFYPLFAQLTNSTLELQANWGWRVLAAVLVNGLAEETMMRGYVFRHLREGRGFWRGAALSTVYFAGYHVPLIFTAGPLIGIIGVIVAIPIGFLTAYIYERGGNNVWGPVLLHVVNNALPFIFVFPAAVQPVATSLFLFAGIIVATLMLVAAYRGGYGRQAAPGISGSTAASV